MKYSKTTSLTGYSFDDIEKEYDELISEGWVELSRKEEHFWVEIDKEGTYFTIELGLLGSGEVLDRDAIATPQWLTEQGFTLTGFGNYEMDISSFPGLEYKIVGIDLKQGGYLRQGDVGGNRREDHITSFWNTDMHGKITKGRVRNLISALTYK